MGSGTAMEVREKEAHGCYKPVTFILFQWRQAGTFTSVSADAVK